MSLKGDLSDFHISSILQLLSDNKKTGRLIVSRSGSERVIYMRDGAIVFGTSSCHRGGFGDILFKKGVLNKRAAEKLERNSEKTGVSSSVYAFKEGIIKKNRLQELMTEYLVEMLCDLLNWKEGNFEFDSENAELPFEPPLIPTMTTIMEAARRCDMRRELEKSMPGRDAVLQISTKKDILEWSDAALDPVGKHLILHINGRRTLQEIIDLSGLADSWVSEGINRLLADGIIEVVPSEEKKIGAMGETAQKAKRGFLSSLKEKILGR